MVTVTFYADYLIFSAIIFSIINPVDLKLLVTIFITFHAGRKLTSLLFFSPYIRVVVYINGQVRGFFRKYSNILFLVTT